MNYHRFLLVLGLLVVLAAGCSEERKRNAARLAAQVEGDNTGDTSAPQKTAGGAVDSVSQDTLSADSQLSKEAAGEVETAQSETAASVGDTQLPAPDSLADTSALAKPSQPVREMPPIISEGFTVQVESSPLRDYIEGQVAAFKQRGYDAYLSGITRPADQKTYYRLRVGRFATKAEADSLSQELNTKFNLQSWVDKTTFGASTPSGEHPR